MQVLMPNRRKIDAKLAQSHRQVKGEQGRAIGEVGQKKRWREHFEKLLNRYAPQKPPNIPPSETDLQIDCDEPQKEEILNTIKQLKNDK